jgi:hypothetical protein
MKFRGGSRKKRRDKKGTYGKKKRKETEGMNERKGREGKGTKEWFNSPLLPPNQQRTDIG